MTVNHGVAGSNPATRAIHFFTFLFLLQRTSTKRLSVTHGPLAQLAEQSAHNRFVQGSNP